VGRVTSMHLDGRWVGEGGKRFQNRGETAGGNRTLPAMPWQKGTTMEATGGGFSPPWGSWSSGDHVIGKKLELKKHFGEHSVRGLGTGSSYFGCRPLSKAIVYVGVERGLGQAGHRIQGTNPNWEHVLSVGGESHNDHAKRRENVPEKKGSLGRKWGDQKKRRQSTQGSEFAGTKSSYEDTRGNFSQITGSKRGVGQKKRKQEGGCLDR